MSLDDPKKPPHTHLKNPERRVPPGAPSAPKVCMVVSFDGVLETIEMKENEAAPGRYVFEGRIPEWVHSYAPKVCLRRVVFEQGTFFRVVKVRFARVTAEGSVSSEQDLVMGNDLFMHHEMVEKFRFDEPMRSGFQSSVLYVVMMLFEKEWEDAWNSDCPPTGYGPSGLHKPLPHGGNESVG